MSDESFSRSSDDGLASEMQQMLSRQLGDKLMRFKDLSRCGDEIWIEHKGQLYRLRETKQGKLILTK